MDVVGLIKKHINARLRSLETMEVVIVESVDLSAWTCAVRPKAKVNVYGNVQDMPQIMSVPIALQKSGGSVVMLPPEVGDVGVVVFSKCALDSLLINKDTVEITIPRTFDINDCVYISGLYTGVENVPSIASGEMLLHHESGSTIKIDSSGNISMNHISGAYIRFDSAGNISLYGRTVSSSEWWP